MTPTPNLPVAIDFLRRLRPAGPWVLSTKFPETDGMPTQTFDPEANGALPEWLARENGREAHVYYSINPTRGPMDKRATKRDIAAVEFLQVDLDGPKTGDIAAGLAKIRDAIDAWQGPAPWAVVFSGGGYQILFRLSAPIPLPDDPDSPEWAAAVDEVEARGRRLCADFGALGVKSDAVFNIDRVFRLPGLVNWKREGDRAPSVASLYRFDDAARHLPAAFPPAEPPADDRPARRQRTRLAAKRDPRKNLSPTLDELGALLKSADPQKVAALVSLAVTGIDPERQTKDQTRSALVRAFLCRGIALGVQDDDLLAGILLDPRFKISDSVRDKKPSARREAYRQIERARAYMTDPRLEALVEEFFIVRNVGGRCRVGSFRRDEFGHEHLDLQPPDEFFRGWQDLKTRVPDGEGKWKNISLARVWFDHPSTRRYRTVGFFPEGRGGAPCPDDVLNLWRGFAVEPVKGDCSLFLAHVENVICRGDVEHFRYLMDWCARLVQYPAEQGWAAVVLRGRQGAGKGIFAQSLGRILGSHFVHVSHIRHLAGHFNALLSEAVLVFADEAFYAGDKSHASTLKTMITEQSCTIEKKGIDAVRHRSYLHLIMASNEDWVVPAAVDDRRFFCLDVLPDHSRDHAYFEAIVREMEDGGDEAFLYALLDRDIRDFNPRRVPATDALHVQKELTLSETATWWLGKLRDGVILPGDKTWGPTVLRDELREDFLRSTRLSRSRSRETELGYFLRSAIPDLRSTRLSGSRQVEMNGRLETVHRPRTWVVPPLDICRRHFDEHYGGPYEWPAEDEPRQEGEVL